MGATTSSQIRTAAADAEKAEALFKRIDKNNDQKISAIEIWNVTSDDGKTANAKWDFESIQAAVQKYDADGDGKLNINEFKHAVDELGAKSSKKERQSKTQSRASKGARTSKSSSKASKSRKSGKDGAKAAQAAPEAPPRAGRRDSMFLTPSAGVAISARLFMRLVTRKKLGVETEASIAEPRPHEQQQQYWARLAGQPVWMVPMERNLSKMPWLSDGETCLANAMMHARQLKRTPLLLDASKTKVVDSFFNAQQGCQVLEVPKMFRDHQLGHRTHAQILKDSRKLFVAAMREGQILYVQLENKVTEFAAHYSSEDCFPMSVFDQAQVDALKPYIGPRGEDLNHQTSEHPFAKVLREADLDPDDGKFHVGHGFQVVVCTHFDKDEYVERLQVSVPLVKMQAIKVIPRGEP